MLDAYIYEGLRTPFGRHAGALAKVRPDDLLADVIRNLLKSSAFKPEQIDDVVVGCANQAGEDSRCVARHATLVAGLPIETPGTVLQRNCASGLDALVYASRAVTCGEGDVFLVGGVESMSRAPYVMGKSESPFGRDVKLFDSTVGPRFSNPKLNKRFGDDQMPQTADNLARKYSISREEADMFAARSQQRYAIAKGEGFFCRRDRTCRASAIPQRARAGSGGRRAPASRHGRRSARENAPPVRRWCHDRRQRLWCERRCRCTFCRDEKSRRKSGPEAARTRHCQRCGRRASAHHGHRTGRGFPESARPSRADDQGYGRHRDQRSLRGTSFVLP